MQSSGEPNGNKSDIRASEKVMRAKFQSSQRLALMGGGEHDRPVKLTNNADNEPTKAQQYMWL